MDSPPLIVKPSSGYKQGYLLTTVPFAFVVVTALQILLKGFPDTLEQLQEVALPGLIVGAAGLIIALSSGSMRKVRLEVHDWGVGMRQGKVWITFSWDEIDRVVIEGHRVAPTVELTVVPKDEVERPLNATPPYTVEIASCYPHPSIVIPEIKRRGADIEVRDLRPNKGLWAE